MRIINANDNFRLHFWSPRWRPCQRITGEFFWGDNFCYIMTHRRVWLPNLKATVVDCGRHN